MKPNKPFMRKLPWMFAVLAITILFFQCRKELNQNDSPDPTGPVITDPVNGSLQGNITDENNQPAVGVTITVSDSTSVTDSKGYFHFTNLTLDKSTSLVTAVKDGYFKSYRVFAATSGENQVSIKLLKKDLAGTIAASAGGDVKLSNGSIVNLPANGIVFASGSSYSGDVKVYTSYIDPKSSDISKTIPGSSTANDRDGKRVALSSYGMLAVELSSGNGEKLQLKNGSTATLTIPIASASVASASATIPLWYLDETTGIWKEEGSATKQGNNYIGEVKHFSYWEAAYSMGTVNLSVTFHTPDNAPLIHRFVRISGFLTDTSTYASNIYYDFTDSLGQVKTTAPANTELTLTVGGSCGATIYTQTIQPLTQDNDLGIIKISDNTVTELTLTGTLTDCNNNPVTKGYAIINFEGTDVRRVSVDNKGLFTTSYTRCTYLPTPTATILGVDENTQQQGDAVSLTLSPAATDAGNVKACGIASEQYINYKLDGTDYTIGDSYGDSVTHGYTQTNITYLCGSAQTGNIYFSFPGTTTGTFPLQTIFWLQNYRYDSIRVNQSSTVTLTNFPSASGEFYKGSFDIRFTSLPADDHTFTGTFKVRKDR